MGVCSKHAGPSTWNSLPNIPTYAAHTLYLLLGIDAIKHILFLVLLAHRARLRYITVNALYKLLPYFLTYIHTVDIHVKFVDMDMDGTFRIHSKPGIS